jgi:hypothetical protein
VETIHRLIDPGRSDDVFVALQKAARIAKRGTLIVYFAGHVLRRDKELLLAVGDSEVEEKLGCVPFSDVEETLLRELVSDAVIVLNVHSPATGSGIPTLGRSGITVLGAAHGHDGGNVDQRIRSVGDAVTFALSGSAKSLRDQLTDGRLDTGALQKIISSHAAVPAPERISLGNTSSLVLRDLREEIAKLDAEAAAEAAKQAAPPPAEPPAPEPKPKSTPPPATEAKPKSTPPPASEAKPKSTPPPASEPKPKSTPPASQPTPASSASREERAVAVRTIRPHDIDPPTGAMPWILAVVVMMIIASIGWFFSHF